MKPPPNDYLKFWRVIRYYMKMKHGLSQESLDVILFLYSEGYFSKDKFDEYSQIVSWSKDRFKDLHRDGWIETFRRRSFNGKALYQLSYKATRMVLDIYRKLNGEEIPTSLSANPMFHKNVSYSDKVYRNMILLMNQHCKEQKLKKRGGD